MKPVWDLENPGSKFLVGVDKKKGGVVKPEDYGLDAERFSFQDPNDAKAPPRATLGVKQKDGTVKNVEHEWNLKTGWKPIPGVEPEAKTFKEGDTREIKKDEKIITQEFKNGKWVEIAKSPQWQPEKEAFHGAFKNPQKQTILLLGKTLYTYQGEGKPPKPATLEEVKDMTRVSSTEEDAFAKLMNMKVQEMLDKEAEKKGKKVGTGEIEVPPSNVAVPKSTATGRPYDAYR